MDNYLIHLDWTFTDIWNTWFLMSHVILGSVFVLLVLMWKRWRTKIFVDETYLYSFVNNSLNFEIWPFISNSCNLKWNIGNINWNKSNTKMQMFKFCFCHISAPERLLFSFLSVPHIITYKLWRVGTRKA